MGGLTRFMHDSKDGWYVADQSQHQHYLMCFCFPLPPPPDPPVLRVQITFRSLEVYPEATFLQADDPSNTMAVLRSIVKDASEDPRVRFLTIPRTYS